jgi:hypothetical protein
MEERNKRVSKYGSGQTNAPLASIAALDENQSKYALFSRPPGGVIGQQQGQQQKPIPVQAHAEKHLSILRNRKASEREKENVQEKDRERDRDSHRDEEVTEKVVEIPSSSSSSSSQLFNRKSTQQPVVSHPHPPTPSLPNPYSMQAMRTMNKPKTDY